MKIITWDYKEQPDWEEVNSALLEEVGAVIHPVDSGSDQYAIVIGPRDLSEIDAQRFYDNQ